MDTKINKVTCNLRFVARGYSLVIAFPKAFAEYNKLIKGKEIYFFERHNKLYISFNDINETDLKICRKIQDSGGTFKSVFALIPSSFRKKFKLDHMNQLALICINDNTFLCQLEKGSSNNQGTTPSESLIMFLWETIQEYYKNEGGEKNVRF